MNTIAVTASISRKAGGLQQSVRRLHQALSELPGVKVSVATLLDEYSVQDVPEWLPLSVSLSRLFGPRAFGFSPGFFPKLLQANADIMHLHGIWQYPSLAVNRWHNRTGRPYLVSSHGMLDTWAVRNSAWKKRIALAFYERRNLEGAACLRALCESEAKAIRQFGLRKPICIIPNGIDLPEGGRRNEEGGNPPWVGLIEPGRKVVLYLGRIHPKKGLVNLIRAWNTILNSQPSTNGWLLAIAGWDQGGHEEQLKLLARELGLSFADVRDQKSAVSSQWPLVFLGPQFGDSKVACYANCDAFILPSFSEGLPMVVLEAWAYAKPVLMTPECNLTEGFAANAAIRIEPNVESVAAGLEELFHLPPSDLCSLGTNGRTLVAGKFTWPKIAVEMKSVYDWVLGGGPKPSCVHIN
jgi:glycosyltransferase involved in cell wall biosynthesis